MKRAPSAPAAKDPIDATAFDPESLVGNAEMIEQLRSRRRSSIEAQALGDEDPSVLGVAGEICGAYGEFTGLGGPASAIVDKLCLATSIATIADALDPDDIRELTEACYYRGDDDACEDLMEDVKSAAEEFCDLDPVPIGPCEELVGPAMEAFLDHVREVDEVSVCGATPATSNGRIVPPTPYCSELSRRD